MSSQINISASIKDLCITDKQKIANLIITLNRIDNEKADALKQLQQEREAYESRIQKLKAQNATIVTETLHIKNRYGQTMLQLQQYQQQIDELRKAIDGEKQAKETNHSRVIILQEEINKMQELMQVLENSNKILMMQQQQIEKQILLQQQQQQQHILQRQQQLNQQQQIQLNRPWNSPQYSFSASTVEHNTNWMSSPPALQHTQLASKHQQHSETPSELALNSHTQSRTPPPYNPLQTAVSLESNSNPIQPQSHSNGTTEKEDVSRVSLIDTVQHKPSPPLQNQQQTVANADSSVKQDPEQSSSLAAQPTKQQHLENGQYEFLLEKVRRNLLANHNQRYRSSGNNSDGSPASYTRSTTPSSRAATTPSPKVVDQFLSELQQRHTYTPTSEISPENNARSSNPDPKLTPELSPGDELHRTPATPSVRKLLDIGSPSSKPLTSSGTKRNSSQLQRRKSTFSAIPFSLTQSDTQKLTVNRTTTDSPDVKHGAESDNHSLISATEEPIHESYEGSNRDRRQLTTTKTTMTQTPPLDSSHTRTQQNKSLIRKNPLLSEDSPQSEALSISVLPPTKFNNTEQPKRRHTNGTVLLSTPPPVTTRSPSPTPTVSSIATNGAALSSAASDTDSIIELVNYIESQHSAELDTLLLPQSLSMSTSRIKLGTSKTPTAMAMMNTRNNRYGHSAGSNNNTTLQSGSSFYNTNYNSNVGRLRPPWTFEDDAAAQQSVLCEFEVIDVINDML